MIRSIAKFLIQYSYDSGSVTTNAYRLPRWLRRWVHSDSQLRDYENELLRLESKLVGQANNRVASGSKSTMALSSDIRVQSTPSRSVLRTPVALAALAASLACVLLVGRWLVFRSTQEDTGSEVVVNIEQAVKEENAKATASLAIANRTLNQESELVKSAGLEGLRFVAQKLPAATVRMMGLSDPKRG